MKYTFLIIAIAALFAACDDSDKGLSGEKSGTLAPTVTTTMADTLFQNGQRKIITLPANPQANNLPTQTNANVVTQQPAGIQQGQITPEQMTQMQHDFAKTQKAVVPKGYNGPLNPEHGKPGHRCDLAVGAPLLTTAPQTVSVGNKTISTSTLQPATAAVKTAPGMNPPHGQPGHRCDIEVGKPLNSKPAAAPIPNHTNGLVPNPVNLTMDTTRKG